MLSLIVTERVLAGENHFEADDNRKRLPPRRTALVADANDLVRHYVVASVGLAKYAVHEATTAAEALSITALRPAPSLVILDGDIGCPSGFEVCRWMKGNSRLAQVPIILMTADFFDRSRALMAGADWYLSKPFAPAALLRAIHEVTAGGAMPKAA